MEATAPVEITQAQRVQYREQGYFVTGVVFDEAALQPVRQEFLRMHEKAIAAAENQDALAQQQAKFRPFLALLQQKSPICSDFCRHEVFLDICRQMLGPGADLTWDQAILKLPSQGDTSFAWHQDMWYATHGNYAVGADPTILMSGDTAITAWVAITRTTVDNGTLWVLPGRHKEGLLPHEWNEEKRAHEGQYDTAWKIPVVMQAGQVLVFNKYLPHCSGPNVSQETRMAYQIGYSVPGLRPEGSPEIMPLMRDGVALA